MVRILSVCVCLLVSMTVAVAADPAVGFRTDGTGAYPDSNPTVEWGRGRNVIWATDMPAKSNATPVVVAGKIFVCSEPSDLICVDAKDGKILWKKSNTYKDVKSANRRARVPKRLPRTDGVNGYSSHTPFTDGKHVWVAFGNGVLACYDMEGVRKWIRFVDLPPHKVWGMCSSPVLVGGKLLLQINALTAFDPTTGKQLWSQPKVKWSWGTPMPMKVGGVDVVIVSGGAVVRVRDGEVMPARVPRLSYNSPLVVGDVVYMIQNKGGAFKLSAARRGGRITAKRLWSVTLSRKRHYGSPVLHNGLLFDVDQFGILAVIDAASGEVVHERKLGLGRGTCYPSPTLAGNRVLISIDNGTTKVLKADKTAAEVATNKLDMFRGSPVFVGDKMYLRTYKKLYCIGKQAESL